jgi:molybdenum cofactor guanylyltransferase
MGSDKASVQFQGEPLWQRQLRLLRQLKPEAIFISARVPPVWNIADATVVLDQPVSRGPLSGITAAMQRMITSHLLVLAVDMPFLGASDLQALVDRTGNGVGAVPMIGDRAEPLAAIYPIESRSEFESSLAGGNVSLQPLVCRLATLGHARLVSIADSEVEKYRSINLPNQL